MNPSDEKLSGVYLFGRDIMTIPCLRQSALTGFSACIGATLLHFLFTSNGSKSAKIGMMTFMGVTFPYWFISRLNLANKEEKLDLIRKKIQEKYDDEYTTLDTLDFGPETFG